MQEQNNTRWTQIRDTLFFQFKLTLDAVRDLLLSPASIVCTLFDIFKGHDRQQSYFYRLMALGHDSDKWLNLFGASSTEQPVQLESSSAETRERDPGVDNLLSKIELLLKEQHAKGGLTASAKASIDGYLNKVVSKDNPKQKND